MKLAFVTVTFPPEGGWGGIGTYVWQTLSALRGRGIHATVITAKQIGLPERINVSDDLTVYRILDPADAGLMRHQVRDLLATLIAQNSLNLVEFPEYGALGLEFQRARPQFPSIVRLHGDTSLCYQASVGPVQRNVRSFFPSKFIFEQSEMERISVGLASLVSAPTLWALSQAVRRKWVNHQQKTEVIPNPFFAFPLHQGEMAKKGPTDVIVLGRLDYHKGGELLPRVISQVHAKNPAARFRFIGQISHRRPLIGTTTGPLYSEWILKSIPEASRRVVEFCGGVPYTSIPDYLSDAKIALFLSNMETFGYTHIEAMHAGLATIIGSKGGARQLGNNGEHVLLIPRSPRAAASAILDLLQNPTESRRLGCAARAMVLETYGPSSILGDRQERLYRSTSGI